MYHYAIVENLIINLKVYENIIYFQKKTSKIYSDELSKKKYIFVRQ